MNTPSLMITGHDVLGVILRRNRARDAARYHQRVAAALRKTHVARISPSETIESNLPLPRK